MGIIYEYFIPFTRSGLKKFPESRYFYFQQFSGAEKFHNKRFYKECERGEKPTKLVLEHSHIHFRSLLPNYITRSSYFNMRHMYPPWVFEGRERWLEIYHLHKLVMSIAYLQIILDSYALPHMRSISKFCYMKFLAAILFEKNSNIQ